MAIARFRRSFSRPLRVRAHAREARTRARRGDAPCDVHQMRTPDAPTPLRKVG
jgi:hypothetical protein